MYKNQPLMRVRHLACARAARRQQFVAFYLAVVLALCASAYTAHAQSSRTGARQKLPAPDKVVGDYLKAVGGKKRLVQIKDADYEWLVVVKDQPMGGAHTQIKAPSSVRMDLIFGNGEINSGANASSAWMRGLDGVSRTLTDAEANTARLQAMLDGSRLVDYKKQNVLARTVMLDQTGASEPAYVVEFSLRNGARLRYWFGASSKLILKIADEARKTYARFTDYRLEDGVLEPHRVERELGDTGALTFLLKNVRYNTGIASTRFDPPSAETVNIAELLREVDRNQEIIDERVSEYSFREKSTQREINGRGEVTKETVNVYEVYPVAGGAMVRKLISENGVPLTAERAAKEEKRVLEALEKAERERVKETEKRERERAKNGGQAKKKEDDDPGISDFLRASELVSPRRERLRDREVIVFDFRPKAGYKPRNDIESIVLKLTGIIWIDPVDKQVMRLEAKLTDSYKMGGGLLASIRPGTAFVFEQKRMSDGVWLPSMAQINVSAKVLIFKGIEINVREEFSDYKRFNGDVEGYKLGTPATNTPAPREQ
jgi:hypothetical protein